MGLDITAYKTVTFVRERTEAEEGDDVEGLRFLYPNPDFVAHADGLAEGFYRTSDGDGETLDFRAGSYSGYSQWRAMLAARLVGERHDIWNNPERYAHKPFVALINFSDCEGMIGPATSALLAADFAANEAKAVEGAETWFADLYRKWRAAFELAAHGGVVVFH